MDSAFQGLACKWARMHSVCRAQERLYFLFTNIRADWIMGALSNDPWRLARFAGLYKAVQSAGGAVSYGMDAVKVSRAPRHNGAWQYTDNRPVDR
jgi:hypothetical protein